LPLIKNDFFLVLVLLEEHVNTTMQTFKGNSLGHLEIMPQIQIGKPLDKCKPKTHLTKRSFDKMM
jgi:hypothetical protein